MMWSSRVVSHCLRSAKRTLLLHSCGSLTTQTSRASVRLLKGKEKSVNGQEEHELTAWVRRVRRMKRVTFMEVSDGSCGETLQLVLPSDAFPKTASVGSCVRASGILRPNPRNGDLEFVVKDMNVVGICDSANHPLDDLSNFENERRWPHLRPNLSSFGSILRLRHHLEHSMRSVYDELGYFSVHTPLMTRMDCEGGGETFRVQEGKSFFDAEDGVHLTVSSQLHLEAAMCGLGHVYTISPAWRAEKSLTRHHLAEFYMVEAESVDANSVEKLCAEAEGFLRRVAKAFWGCIFPCEIEGLEQKFQLPTGAASARIEKFVSDSIERITFAEGLEILLRNASCFRDATPTSATVDFSKEQEFFLTRHVGDRPVFVTDFPACVKPMYCALNSDGTAQAVDLLLPGIGEVMGGSVRENDVSTLQQRMLNVNSNLPASLQWYLDLRRFGSPPHGGYGIGFDRLLQFFLGIQNIKDIVPFPRFYKSCRL